MPLSSINVTRYIQMRQGGLAKLFLGSSATLGMGGLLFTNIKPLKMATLNHAWAVLSRGPCAICPGHTPMKLALKIGPVSLSQIKNKTQQQEK